MSDAVSRAVEKLRDSELIEINLTTREHHGLDLAENVAILMEAADSVPREWSLSVNEMHVRLEALARAILNEPEEPS